MLCEHPIFKEGRKVVGSWGQGIRGVCSALIDA